jgi:hypothetical protein
MAGGPPDQSAAAGLFPAVVSPENEEKRHADHHRADDHQDETNGADVDARRIPADRIAENRADSDEDERTSESAGRDAKER